jgi:hypothetical protein
MDENVLAILTLDESKAFCGIKPLYCTCFFPVSSTSSYDGLFKIWKRRGYARFQPRYV